MGSEFCTNMASRVLKQCPAHPGFPDENNNQRHQLDEATLNPGQALWARAQALMCINPFNPYSMPLRSKLLLSLLYRGGNEGHLVK